MENIKSENLADLFQGVADIFAEKKDELCAMDANMGDGDLGLTMNKGYGALPQLIRDNAEEGNIGRTLMKAAMKMQGLVPSTMGTLMSSGIMEGGKALKDKSEIGPAEMSQFLTGFAAGIQKRGKCALGDRTILDALDPAAKKAAGALAEGGDLKAVLDAACEGAAEGVEATKDMIPKYGKAAVFSAKAKGIADQGAVAGQCLVEGLARYTK
jgi:dihydroxyacetone kinase-like protein